MRRFRTHRLTGSARRLLAATALTTLATGGFATVASAAPGSSGPSLNLAGVPVVGGLLSSVVSTSPSPISVLPQLPLPTTPALPPVPVPPPPQGGCLVLCLPTPPPTPPPSLPSPPVCLTSCTGAGNGGNQSPVGKPGSGTQPPSGGQAPAPSSSAGSAPASGPAGGRGRGGGGSFGAGPGGLAAPAGGLNLAQPVPVEQLTPLAGISFGQAPYVWPLFLILDVFAAAAVAIAVRKTWSTSRVD